MRPALPIAMLLFAAQAARAQSGEVRIYRCNDAASKQTLRDTPCPKGQQQQVREMLRPKDAPERRTPAAAAAAVKRTANPLRVVVLAPPQAMYECTDRDGKPYTSENGEGNPRWVPLWTLGYPVVRPRTSLGNNIGGTSNPRPGSSPRTPLRDINWPVASGGGQWIRDTCAMLPPQETCARLRDRRSEIRTRFFNAMPSERDVLRTEERGINARLDNDCGGR